MLIIGIVIGAFLGWIAQSKRVCIGSSIQRIYINNNGRFLQLLLIFIALQAVGIHLFIDKKLIDQQQISSYSWPAIIIGSFLFGIGFIVAIQQKGSGMAIEKLLGNGVTIATFIIISFVFSMGIFTPIDASLLNFQQRENDMTVSFGVSRLILALLVLFGSLLWLLKKQWLTLQQIKQNRQRIILFLFITILAILAWYFTVNTNQLAGLALTTPILSFIESLKTGNFTTVYWAIYIVVGFIAASSVVALKQGDLKRVKWSRKSLFSSIVSGILMAVGVKLAGDCLIGNSLVQTAIFSWHGWLSFGSMMIGIWTVVFYSRIRPTIKSQAKEKVLAS